jgi:hypothetical protein
MVRITQGNAVAVARMVVQGAEFFASDFGETLLTLAQVISTPSGTLPCIGGGSFQNSANDVAPVGEVSAGDSATVTFNNCVFDLGGIIVTLRGQFTIVVNEFTEILPSGLDAEYVYTFRNFEMDVEGTTIQANGGAVVELESPDGNLNTTVARGDSLTLEFDDDTNRFTRRFTEFRHEQVEDETAGNYSVGIEGRVHDSDVGGAVDYVTDIPFGGESDLNPGEGEVTAAGGANSSLRIEVLDDEYVRLHIDEDGDGTYEASIDVSWSELLDS